MGNTGYVSETVRVGYINDGENLYGIEGGRDGYSVYRRAHEEWIYISSWAEYEEARGAVLSECSKSSGLQDGKLPTRREVLDRWQA